MGIRVFAAILPPEVCEGETAKGMCLMPREQQEHILRIHNARKRRETLWGRALLRFASGMVFGFSELPGIDTQRGGKPVFAEYPQAHFSISHSGGIVLCAAGDAPVGADVERIRPVRPAVVRRLLGEETVRSVSEKEASRRFFEAWVLREAEGKRRGEGLTGRLCAPAPPVQGFYRLYSDLMGYCVAVSSDSRDLSERVELAEPGQLWI